MPCGLRWHVGRDARIIDVTFASADERDVAMDLDARDDKGAENQASVGNDTGGGTRLDIVAGLIPGIAEDDVDRGRVALDVPRSMRRALASAAVVSPSTCHVPRGALASAAVIIDNPDARTTRVPRIKARSVTSPASPALVPVSSRV